MLAEAASERYQHPRQGFSARFCNTLANASSLLKARRAAMSKLPFPVLESDVRNVVYLTWFIDVEALKPWVPAGVKLWQRGGRTPLTILTYSHGNFGPASLGRLRGVCPSPMQSNWCLYVESLPGKSHAERTVLFLKDIMDSSLYALGTRLLSDALPTHLAARFHHHCNGQAFSTQILGGRGSAPELAFNGELVSDKTLPASFAPVFRSWYCAVEFLACQQAAVRPIPELGRLAYTRMDLPVDLESVRACRIHAERLRCPFVEHLLGHEAEAPFAFVLPRVKFRALSETLI